MSSNMAVMVDLETLSTATDAAIIQIAAVAFDLDTGATYEDFSLYVRRGPGSIDRDTVNWWMQQSGAKKLASCVNLFDYDLGEALCRFSDFLSECGVGTEHDRPLYAHGAAFDFPVLRSAYAACGLRHPWSHRHELCTRTYYRELGGVPEVPLPKGYVKHDALSDCRLQVAQLVEARRQLGLVET